jgi:diaminopimelate decarboxylase
MASTRDGEGRLRLGGVRLAELFVAAEKTPAYVYDLDGIAAEARELEAAFEGHPHLIAYAVKANSAGPIVRTLAKEGCGADVVSGGELAVALACGILPERIVYSGVAKKNEELDQAILTGAQGIRAIQVESLEEIDRVCGRAREMGRVVRVALRVNPAVHLETLATHAHIATGHDEAKFGIPHGDFDVAVSIVRGFKELQLVGLTSHVGSQFTTADAYLEASQFLFGSAKKLRASGVKLEYVDTGGGFGIDYGDGCPLRPADFVRKTRALQHASGLDDLALFVEPGRSLVAAHGVLVATVIQSKTARVVADDEPTRRWLMIDAGMNDLIRPALYQARHRIVPLEFQTDEAELAWRVVGPVCESSDDFGLHLLPKDPPHLVAILDVGAYGFTMASQYNGRALATEIFLRGGTIAQVSPASRVEDWARARVMGS